jgi:hypothetical protein
MKWGSTPSGLIEIPKKEPPVALGAFQRFDRVAVRIYPTKAYYSTLAGLNHHIIKLTVMTH